MASIRLRAPVNATEDASRVSSAVLNLFPEATLTTSEGQVSGDGGSLERLAELIRNHQIPDTARGTMLRGRRGAVTRFRLGKQAAYVNHPNFGASGDATGPLGDIEVVVEAKDEDSLLKLLYETAPDTTCDAELSTIPPSLRPNP